MAVDERTILAYEGVVVAAIDVLRTSISGGGGGGAMGGGRGPAPLAASLSCRARVTTRGMWVDQGLLLDKLTRVRGAGAGGAGAGASIAMGWHTPWVWRYGGVRLGGVYRQMVAARSCLLCPRLYTATQA
jgi:hypothetical protein